MPGIIQKIRSILIPEIGLDVEPESVIEAGISTDFTRSIAHLAARYGNRSVLLKATSDGRLLAAVGGTSMEIYHVEGELAAPDAYDVGSTFEQVDAIYVTDILVETNDGTVSFRNAAGAWGDDIALPVGFHSKDLLHYGIRFQNRVGAALARYEIVMYR